MVRNYVLQPWDRFGRLVITWEKMYRGNQVYEKCVCDCWNIKYVRNYSILYWLTKSCWCLQKQKATNTCIKMTRHGLRYTRIYRIFYWIYTRCNNEHDKDYPRYWWRWIICNRWNFEAFYKDMNETYEKHVKEYWEKNTTIDRIDVNWNYNKENCRWATLKQQANNRKSCHVVEYDGMKYPSIRSLCGDLWLNYHRIRKRIQVWWDIIRAIETI